MRRLTITGFCAIALLLGCTGGGVGSGPPIKLPCPGKDVKTGDHHVGRSKTTIHFETGGNCKFTALQFDPPYGPIPLYPPGFSNRVEDSSGKTISYDYEGTPPAIPIPAAGYPFSYENDDRHDGNGSGVVKN